MATMFQQLAQSIGVALAAIVVHLTLAWNHNQALTAPALAPAFFVIGLLSLFGLFFFVPLHPNAGEEISGRK
jgi:hypothetical protein